MRKIKFRVWDTKAKMMYPKVIHRGAISTAAVEISYDLTLHVPNHLKLMQYTGLQDKNSVEIYEGDIVTHLDYDFNMIVRWGDCLPGFMACDGIEKDAQCFDLRYVKEVIGNIYENKEVLDGT